MRPLLVALVAAAGLIGGAYGFKAVDVTQTLQPEGGEQTTTDLQLKQLPQASGMAETGSSTTPTSVPTATPASVAPPSATDDKDAISTKVQQCDLKKFPKCDLGFAAEEKIVITPGSGSKTLMPVVLSIPFEDKKESVPIASIHFSGDGPLLNSIEDFLVDALTGEVASSFCATQVKVCGEKKKAFLKTIAAENKAKKVSKDDEEKKLDSLMSGIKCDKASITSTREQQWDKQREPAQKILDGLQILAGDTNISPAKAKQLSDLTKSSDLTGEIAKALDAISCYSAAPVVPAAAPASCPRKWNVYMANVLVGKKRTGYSLMNTQIFKSESGKPNFEFDGTLVAVKKEYETRSGFRVIGDAASSRKGDAGTQIGKIRDAPVKGAFTFDFIDGEKTVVDVDAVTTGSVFLDHAVIEFEIWKHKFVVLNVASVIDVDYKDWGTPYYQWFDNELIDGINTMKELDQKLYKCQQKRLEELYVTDGGLSDKATRSLKQVFKEVKANDFDGMRTLKKDKTSIFYPKNRGPGDIKLVRDKLVQGMGDFVHLIAKTCDDIKTAPAAAPAGGVAATPAGGVAAASADTLPAPGPYFNTKAGEAKIFVCSGEKKILAKISEWEKAALKKTTAKDIFKFTGEQLVKIGFRQPYGGFGDAVAKLGTKAEREVVSPEEIYKIIASIATKGKVIVGSEISVKRIIPEEAEVAATK